MKILNVGILAHVDAGKTSLTERLLFNAGVIETLGSVDKGTTQTDSMALERKRGITIRAAVTSFTVDDLKINLVDTPGHPDFIIEVEHTLPILDAVILVISAVEGIQPQTRILARTLQKMHMPTIIFINKIDRAGARSDELIEEIKTQLFSQSQVMVEVSNIGTRHASVSLNTLTSPHCMHPIFFGSALTGVGIKELTSNVAGLLKVQHNVTSPVLSASIFKIERGTHHEKIVYTRVYSGQLHVRKPMTLGGKQNTTVKITAMQLFKNGKTISVNKASAGEIVKAWGLQTAHIDDYIGEKPSNRSVEFARPSLEVSVSACSPQDKAKLYSALQTIAEQDSLIETGQSKEEACSLKLYGEVQREIIASLLQDEYGLEVKFSQPQILYIERLCGTGQAYAEKFAPDNMFIATLGFRIRAGSPGSGILFKSDAGIGRIPVAYMKIVEEMVYQTLQEGVYGWEVTDCIVEITHAGYESAMSTGTDFRILTPLLIAEVLQKAGTKVYVPTHNFELVLPCELMNRVIRTLVGIGATVEDIAMLRNKFSRLCGSIPLEKVYNFAGMMPDLTKGEGAFVTEPGEYRVVHGSIPSKTRTNNNPFNKQEYLRQTLKRG